ncbi:branched-chain amino acid ABC transporter permease [Bordetella petrii]|uniref:branched-chain amino acid ABC transporter permease n=1 Tax=Bordetella petrii TaxID=94624 RepID=UPI00372DC798
MRDTQKRALAQGTSVVAIAVAAPLLLPVNIATEILIFSIFALATNLLVGRAGLYSFGQAAFFGAGGYAAGFLFVHTDAPLLAGLALAMATGAALAAAIGSMSIRRTGIYFMMLTFAFNQMIYYLAYSWRAVTGGEDGLGGIGRPALWLPGLGRLDLGDHHAFYVLTAVCFLLVFLLLYRLTHSPLGLVLEAARQNARRTASLGYSVYRAQLLAFVVAGGLSGLAGALFAMLYRIMPIDAVSWANSGNAVFMVVIGGISSMLGPVFGAAIFIWLQGFFSLIWARWPLLFGVFVILVVLFLKGGVVELFERLCARLGGKAARAGEAGK